MNKEELLKFNKKEIKEEFKKLREVIQRANPSKNDFLNITIADILLIDAVRAVHSVGKRGVIIIINKKYQSRFVEWNLAENLDNQTDKTKKALINDLVKQL